MELGHGSRMSRRFAALAVAVFVAGCGATSGGGAPDPALPTTALVGGRVQVSPDAAVIPDGVVVVRGGAIAAVGGRGAVSIPPNAQVIDCAGTTVTAGFWNSHVHFTQSVWSGAAA